MVCDPRNVWRPISCEPKGDVVLGWSPKWPHPITVRWVDDNSGGGWRFAGLSSVGPGDDPTHWAPVLEPPLFGEEANAAI
jgi:hypothetical protein